MMYAVPLVYNLASSTAYVDDFSFLSVDYEDFINYHINPLSIDYVPLDAVGGTVTATGELDFSASEVISTGDTVQVLCVPNGTGTVQPYITTVIVGANGTWNTRIDNATILGIVNDQSTSSGSGSVSMDFDMPSMTTTYEPVLDEDAEKAVAEMMDIYVGDYLTFNNSYAAIGFLDTGYLYNPSRYVSGNRFDTLSGFNLYAGNTYRISFSLMATSQVRFVDYLSLLLEDSSKPGSLTHVDDSYVNVGVSLSDMYAMNIGTADNPSSQFFFTVNLDLACLKDFTLDVIYFYRPFVGVSNQIHVEIIDSDAAVVSKLQQLLDYYQANPPEADDLRAQTEMQHALEAAAIEDAKGSVSVAAQAAAPGTVVVDPGGGAITIGSALTTWTATINSFVSAVPMLAVILAFFVFCALVRYLLQR